MQNYFIFPKALLPLLRIKQPILRNLDGIPQLGEGICEKVMIWIIKMNLSKLKFV